MNPADLVLGALALAAGVVLAWRGTPLFRAVLFLAALAISAMAFLPGPQLVALAGRDTVTVLERWARATPWGVPEWAHFAGFLGLGLLLWLGRADLRGMRGLVLLALLCAGAELAQGLTPGREPRLDDIALNLAGAAAGVALAIGLRALRGARGHRPRGD